MRLTHLLMGESLFLALERHLATDFLEAGDYLAFCLALLTLPTTTTTATPPAWPQAPNFISFHNTNGEEELLTLTPCATQLYVLPTGVQQVIIVDFALISSAMAPMFCYTCDHFFCRCLLMLFRSGCVHFRVQRPWFDGSKAG